VFHKAWVILAAQKKRGISPERGFSFLQFKHYKYTGRFSYGWVCEVALQGILGVIKACCECRVSTLWTDRWVLRRMDFENCITEAVVLRSGITLHLGGVEPVEPVMFCCDE
jgi:hypothetical protein